MTQVLICLVLLQVPKCFLSVQTFWARPKIKLHLVLLLKILCRHRKWIYCISITSLRKWSKYEFGFWKFFWAKVIPDPVYFHMVYIIHAFEITFFYPNSISKKWGKNQNFWFCIHLHSKPISKDQFRSTAFADYKHEG